MRTISLRRFNAEVHTLTEPTVIALKQGRDYTILGVFVPDGAEVVTNAAAAHSLPDPETPPRPKQQIRPTLTQAERDAVLRRVSKGAKDG